MIVELAVGKSHYKISCEPKEKEKLLELADSLNERVNKLSLALKNADEKTLLLVAALMIQEEANQKATRKIHKSEYEDDEARDENARLNEQDIYDTVSENMENIADYIEKLTAKIQNY
jgi:cell division protein ZapA (FtsZ GTPase activity inhibitor)